MKILSVKAENFGSYDHFEMDLDNLGLALLYGKTGAGKSTIMDMVCWGVYGITGKDGAADGIRAWGSVHSTTYVEVQLQLSNKTLLVRRTRGRQCDNDVYFTTEPGSITRGKDSRDTQRLLESTLGVSAELFLTASYFSDFSTTSTFFMAKAKDRRSVFEKIAPLQFPTNLLERITNDKKETKIKLREAEKSYATVSGRLDQLQSSYNESLRQVSVWAKKQELYIRDCEVRSETFEEDKSERCQVLKAKIKETEEKKKSGIRESIQRLQQEISDLQDEECKECGQVQSNGQRLLLQSNLHSLQTEMVRQSSLRDRYQDLTKQLKTEEAATNHYGYLAALEKNKSNPFTSQTSEISSQCLEAKGKESALKCTLKGVERRLGALDQLSSLCGDLRGILLTEAISQAQDNINNLLTNTFDSEFSVAFTVSGDDLEVSITKSGYQASYSQLSKGQRRLLSLCFSVTVMEMSANAAGVHVNLLMFDEGTDGCDSELKEKAFALYQDLATKHETVLVIEHDTNTQMLFDRRYRVELEGDLSHVCEE